MVQTTIVMTFIVYGEEDEFLINKSNFEFVELIIKRGNSPWNNKATKETKVKPLAVKAKPSLFLRTPI